MIEKETRKKALQREGTKTYQLSSNTDTELKASLFLFRSTSR